MRTFFQKTIHRFIRWVAATRLGARVFGPFLHKVDIQLHRFSGGKHLIPALLAGLDSLILTTTGAKSGKTHSVPLLYFTEGRTIVVLASSWGRLRHPDWYYNLKAHPEAFVSVNGVSGKYVAEESRGSRRDRYWQRAVAMYPGYAKYESWAQGREIKIMVLTPVSH